jgi:hypothetical protein
MTCPRCNGPVIHQKAIMTLPDLSVKSTSIFMCITEECAAFAQFQFQSAQGMDLDDPEFICEECKKELDDVLSS